MASIKPTATTTQPVAPISSKSILKRLEKHKRDLRATEEAKDYQHSRIKKLETEINDLQHEKYNQKTMSSNQAVVKREKKRQELRVQKAINYQEDIDRENKSIKEWEKKLQEAKDRETKNNALHASSLRKPGQDKTKQDAVASSARITKSNARPSHLPSPPRKTASARAPRPSQRFKLQDNKFSQAVLKEKDKNAALASKSNKQSAATRSGDKAKPLTKASVTTNQQLTGKKQSSGAASKKNNPPSCATQSRAAKRPAPDDEDDSDDDLPHNGRWRNLKKKKLDSATAASNPAAPSTATDPRSNGVKKRSAPEDGNEEPNSKRQKTSLEHDETTNATASNDHATSAVNQIERKQPARGLANLEKACFSNAFIQMFDTACDGRNVDSILGELSEVENFGIGQTHRTTRSSSKRADPIEVIEKAAQDHETARISPSKHLRSVIDQLHKAESGDSKSDTPVSAEVFRKVFAYGATESDSARRDMHGERSSCCSEYYQLVQQALVDEHPGAETTRNLMSMFDVQTEKTDACSETDCSYTSKASLDGSSNHHTVLVPRQGTCKLSDIYQKSTSDNACPQCPFGTIETRSKFIKVGHNLVMTINRTELREKAKSKRKGKGKLEHRLESAKIMTEVEIDIDRIQPGDKTEYELAAVIYHSGSSMDDGHYTIARKCGETWYHFSDEKRTKIDKGDVTNGEKYGQSTMILWKKVAA